MQASRCYAVSVVQQSRALPDEGGLHWETGTTIIRTLKEFRSDTIIRQTTSGLSVSLHRVPGLPGGPGNHGLRCITPAGYLSLRLTWLVDLDHSASVF